MVQRWKFNNFSPLFHAWSEENTKIPNFSFNKWDTWKKLPVFVVPIDKFSHISHFLTCSVKIVGWSRNSFRFWGNCSDFARYMVSKNETMKNSGISGAQYRQILLNLKRFLANCTIFQDICSGKIWENIKSGSSGGLYSQMWPN